MHLQVSDDSTGFFQFLTDFILGLLLKLNKRFWSCWVAGLGGFH
jgi:hypothetical protein